MFKQLLLPLAAVAVFIVVVGLLVSNSSGISIPGLSSFIQTPTPTATLSVGAKTIKAEIANTESSRELGLGGRSFLAKDSGMLFVFDSKGVAPGFWMKGMLIPLDLIWIKGSKVAKIDKNIPVPSSITPDSELTVYSPNQPIDYVLEVNGGYSDDNSIKVGDTVTGLPK